MSCPSPNRLAAASLGADPRALVHADTCERCSAELAAMAEVGAFARRAPVRTVPADRRAQIAALVMASSDAAELPVRRSRVPVAIVALAALAAAVALTVWRVQPAPRVAVVWPVMVPVARPIAPPVVAHEPSPAPAPAPAVALHEFTPAPAPAPAPPRAPVVPLEHAHPSASIRVFAGSQERAHAGQVSRDQVTLEPGPIVARARVAGPSAFEQGWTALREARYADAITAFDQVTGPSVAEDAAYWAAIASARAGDQVDAVRRLTAFVAKFPASERLAEARALLARFAP